jgi:hypothetical protein
MHKTKKLIRQRQRRKEKRKKETHKQLMEDLNVVKRPRRRKKKLFEIDIKTP